MAETGVNGMVGAMYSPRFLSFLLAFHVWAVSSTLAGEAISLERLGVEAQKQYSGDGIGIEATRDGARLRSAFQKLEAKATTEGLWLESTEAGQRGDRFRVMARAVGRGTSLRDLAETGQVMVGKSEVLFARPDVMEEYRVSVDGVRQDFVVPQRPEGTGGLRVALAVNGATAAVAGEGVKLTLAGSGREIAYSRLQVTDATGRELKARMNVTGVGGLTIDVDDAGAVYPVRIDPTFSDADWVTINPGTAAGANGTVRAMTTDAAGNLYIGGDFTVVGNLTARVAKWNGTAWTALGTGPGIVYVLAIIGGEVYAGGAFNGGIAKWNGSAWVTLGGGTDGSVSAIVASGADLYVGGSFTKAGGEWANRIAKWNGSVWSPLGLAFDGGVGSIAVVGNKVYAAGSFTAADVQPVGRLAQWDGSVWSSGGGGVTGVIGSLLVKDSVLYVGGNFTPAGGNPNTNVATWDGNTWTVLGSGSTATVSDMVFVGGDLYVAGNYPYVGSISKGYVAKWDGGTWTEIGSSLDSSVRALAARGTTIYIGGEFKFASEKYVNRLAKWDGNEWSVATPTLDNQVKALALLGSDIYVGGSFIVSSGVGVNRIAKWDGSEWSRLGTGMDGDVLSLAVRGGDVYAGGNFTTAGGVTVNRVARWDGTAWSALGLGVNGPVADFAFMGTDMYAGGKFTTAGGIAAKGVAKWDGNGWSPLGSGADDVRALVVSGQDLYAGGKFVTAGGLTVNHVARWDGTEWSALGVGILGELFDMVMLDGHLYAGGYFTAAGGIAANHIAKWDGAMWSPLGSGVNFGVHTMAVSGGDLYAGGAFTSAGGVAGTKYIAKWSGLAWSALGTGTDDYVNAMAADESNHLFIGGLFLRAGSALTPYVAKANLPQGPEIALEGPAGTALADGGSKSYGNVAVGAVSSFSFNVQNIGTTALEGLTASADGAQAGEFVITAQPASSLERNGQTTVTVEFRPGALGPRTAALHIASNDADENPFDVTLTGTGIEPEINVEQPALTSLTSGGTKSYGSVSVGSNSSLTFTIRNNGTANLTGVAVTKDGSEANDFTITSTPGSLLSPGGTTTFAVRFAPSAGGVRTAVLHIASNDADENPFAVTLIGTGLAPKINVEQPALTSLTRGGTQSYGSVSVGSNSSLTFTIRNNGTANLTGVAVTKDGSEANDFTVTSTPGSLLSPGGITSFAVRFAPSAAGVRTAVLHIASNDLDQNPFDLTVTGTGLLAEIAVEQPPVTDISDGGARDFGDVTVGSNLSLSFTIKNLGNGNLTGLTFTKDGTHSTDFTVTTSPTAPVAPNGSTTFTVRFTPGASGARTAAIHIASNDSDEGIFDLTLTGTGVQAEIAVEEPVGTGITDGGTKNFGSLDVGSNAGLTFTIQNLGTADLTGLTISKDGTNSGDFVVTASPAAPVAPNGSTTFTVQFAPSALGTRTAAIHIANNDSNENPFDINLSGTGLAPEIAVEQPVGTNITDGGSKSFGNVLLGASSSLSFTVKNVGNSDLTGIAITKEGTEADEFTITGNPAATVTAGSSTSFTVSFAPSVVGIRNAVVRIANNDSNEAPFDIALTGTGTAAEIGLEQPAGSGIADGGGKSFDEVNVGATKSLTFTLRNTGSATLTGVAISKDGAQAGEFMVTAQPAASVVPGGSTTFAVAFTPTARGSRSAVLHIASNDADESPYDVTLTGIGVAPEIVVEQPAGSAVIDSGSRNFGTVGVGASASLTFTIKNTGDADLTGLEVAIDGDHPGDFAVTVAPSAPVAGDGSTELVVTFAPKDAGTRTAFLHVANNDGDEAPFDVVLTGQGAPAAIAFDEETYSVAQGAAVVNVTLVRQDGSLAATATLNTDDGTASKAPPFAPGLAGFDYTDLTGAATVIAFAPGETTKDVQIPLIPGGSSGTANKRFTATLSDPDEHAALGAVTTAVIQILVDDTRKPELTLTTPGLPLADRLRTYNQVAPLVVTGTAGDVKGIERVEVVLNGGEPATATLGATTMPTKVPFVLPIVPVTGTNVLEVTAYDLRGNNMTITRSFNFVRRHVLTLLRTTPTTAADAAGTLAMTATPGVAATGLKRTAGTDVQTAHIVPGTSVKVVATTKAGFVFNEWVNLPDGATVVGDTAIFEMPDGDLTVTADLIRSPFTAPAGRANQFVGLVHPTGGAESSNATEGFISGTLSGAGSFTGKLWIDGVTQPVAAVFYGDGTASFKAGSQKLATLGFASRTLGLTYNADVIEVTVTSGVGTSAGVARRAIYSSANKAPGSLLNSRTKGFYTVCFPAKAQTPGMDAASYPQGHGFGTISLTTNGVLSLTGTLADGTAVTANSALVAGDASPVYVPLATPGNAAKKGGSFGGELVFDSSLPDSDVTGADFFWFRPEDTTGKTALYTGGWPNGISVDAVGALYGATVKVQEGLGLGPVDAADDNAELWLTEGRLTAEILKTNFNISGNAVAKIPANDASFVLTLAPASGSFSGSFTPNWTLPAAAKPTFKGILLQKGGSKGGYGFFLSNAKGDPDPESGRVELGKPD